MRGLSVKTIIIAIWLIAAGSISFLPSRYVDAQYDRTAAVEPRRPDKALIDKFDTEVRTRFLTMPFFGITRIAPREPVPFRSSHIGSFSPQTPEEVAAVKAFNDDRWDVGIYLYGRRSEPKLKNEKPTNKFSIRYRVNRPVPVSFGLREGQLQEPAHLIKYVKQAFLLYQKAQPDEATDFEFENGDWSYIARPVRAMNQSCLQCHNDYVVIDKLPNGQFKLKKREVGDVNGILLYAFRKQT
jgi:hypothetical protein